MSKLAKIPVIIKEGVNIVFENDSIKVSGPKGSLSFNIPSGIEVKVLDGRILVSLKDKKNEGLKPSLGLTRAMVSNMVKGVSLGFEKRLELSGVGYRAQVSGKDLTISVGFSHPVKFTAGEGLSFAVDENVILISGANKDLVGNMAAVIRGVRPPEPYKGKGIKYKDEKIRRKVGKAAKALGTK
ncbi:MAG: 50S ribosomal protein L6 [Candidatus Levybacteria bacterium]|nr:50S ribosomal protein L6 [Candidatus Levybacteria bacterium]MDZ4227927.1 50S ribosomal protein L6 [Candidatus Levybacteria bacterium]